MPNKQAAFKALRQTKVKTARNTSVKEGVEFVRRGFKKALDQKNEKLAQDSLTNLIKLVDKAVQKGIYKLNTGARIKSRTTAALRSLSTK